MGGLYLAYDAVSTFFSLNLKEILVYNSALSSTDRTNVENWLKTKWGLP